MRSLAWLALGAFLLCAMPADGAEFPFERELLLDVEPMRGSKRVPSLEVETNGRAAIDLWCLSGPAQINVVGETITIMPGALSTRPCPAGQARNDEELLSALSQVTRWRREDDLVVLIGPQMLRFRLSTH